MGHATVRQRALSNQLHRERCPCRTRNQPDEHCNCGLTGHRIIAALIVGEVETLTAENEKLKARIMSLQGELLDSKVAAGGGCENAR